MSGNVLTGLYLSILFGANVLGSIAGFGAGMLSIPFLTQLFDPKLIIMASTMTCVLNIWIAVANWHNIVWKKLACITLYLCIGLPVGVIGLKILPVNIIKLILGIFMITLGGYGLLKLRVRRIEMMRISPLVLRIFLIVGGVLQGALSSGGSFVLLYAQQEMEDKKQFRATLALLWTVISFITTIQYAIVGTLTKDAIGMFFLGTPAVLLGIFVGGKLCGRMSQRAFMYVVNLLVLAAGIINCISYIK